MKLVVGGIKGGTGKTTIATNLAYMRSATGKKVLLVDADEQKSTSKWCNQRIGMKVQSQWTTIQLSGIYLYKEIRNLESNYDDIIIDAGGRDNSSQRSALTIADIFLMPFRPEVYDVWTIREINDLVTQSLSTNPQLRPIAVLNQTLPNAECNIMDAKEIISECKELSCLEISIGLRRSFGNAAAIGLSVMELPSNKKQWIQKAQQEMQSLYDKLYQ